MLKVKRALDVSLQNLVSDKNLIFGKARDRSYGALDAIIQPYLHEEHMVDLPLQDQTTLFRMLMRGRINYTLGLAYEAGYIGQLLNQDQNFVSLPIADYSKYVMTYPNCTDNAWGRAIVDKINAVNLQPALHLMAIETVGRWLGEEETQRLFDAHNKIYREIHGRSLAPAR